MKTLVELGIEPCVGMVVQSPTHGRLLHYIIEIETGSYGVWVRSINERGTHARNSFIHLKNNWFFVGHSNVQFKSLFECSAVGREKVNETKKLIKQIEDLWE